MSDGRESKFDWATVSSEPEPSEADGRVPDYDPPSHEYPPDALFEGRFPISFTATVALLAILASVASIARVGFPETVIPYNYPLFAGVVYIVAVLFVLRQFHAILDQTKRNLASVLERAEADKAIFDRETEVTPRDLVTEMERVMSLVFHPGVIFVGGLVGGVFALAVMFALDVFDAYPYLFLDYAYGAGHGFFYGPLLGSLYLVHKISSDYILDIDILAPDGVGGYRGVGEAIVDLISYGIVLVTLDFVILSSVSFLDRPMFQTAVFALYGFMLGTLVVLALYGVLTIRERLLTIREHKTDAMREQFKLMEVNYWRKLDRYESPEPEATHIETMNTMFEQLQSMALWPINLAAAAKLVLSVVGSLSIAALEMVLLEGEMPAVISSISF